MQHALTYKTSFTKDSYSIYRGNIQIGKLYKTEWLGSTIESTINEHNFRFVSKEFFRPVISIFDKDSKQNIGTVSINNFFKISPSATLSLVDNKHYRWTTKGIFSYDWEWLDLSNTQIVASSNEPLDLFKQKGTISLTQQNIRNELLITLGIQLRNVIQRKTVITRILSLIVLALTLPKLFA